MGMALGKKGKMRMLWEERQEGRVRIKGVVVK